MEFNDNYNDITLYAIKFMDTKLVSDEIKNRILDMLEIYN